MEVAEDGRTEGRKEGRKEGKEAFVLRLNPLRRFKTVIMMLIIMTLILGHNVRFGIGSQGNFCVCFLYLHNVFLYLL